MNAAQVLEDAAERCGLPDFGANAFDILARAETALSRRLRVPEMRELADVALTDGVGATPDRLVSVIEARQGATVLARSKWHVADGVVEGPGESVTLLFYAALPPLATVGTNWLSVGNPELYVAAVTAQALLRKGEAGGALAYLDGLIREENAAGVRRGGALRTMNLARGT